MVRSGGHRGDDDLSPVTDRIGLRGRYSTSNIPSTPIPFATSFHYDTGAPGSSTQPPYVPIRSRPPFPSYLPHTPMPYDVYGSSQSPSYPTPTLYDPYVHAPSIRPHIPYRFKAWEPLNEFNVPPDSSYNTHDYTATDFGVSSSEPFIGRDSGEPDKVRSLHIGGEDDERVHDDGDDDDDDSNDPGDEEQPVPLAPVAPASSSGGRPRHGKGKGLTKQFHVGYEGLLGVLRRLPIFTRNLVRPDVLIQRSWLGAVRQFEWRQCIPAHLIRPMEPRRPANNRMYVVTNIFVEALWLEAPSHLLIETWTRVLAILIPLCLHQLSWT
ncbi:hypothetical protein M9H77_13153 [Catharanthus roseus]|uniref:Uncharacterized protein n=1 Tax=Catharanthus roseus TaxID=4058 RepID=A0ACC0BJL2_CATRO|nr:hypothetical protein M9H77_13153 [Catharanthus roseus]